MQAQISVIIPAYNRAKTIDRAINSVLNQTVTNWELIVVDDCSTDKTIELIEQNFANDKRIKIHPLTQNGGANRARNIGAKLATSPLLAFFDSDDELHPENLKNHIEKFENNFDLGINYVFATCIQNNKEVNKFDDKLDDNAELKLYKLMHGVGASTSGMCVSQKAFEYVGGFDEHMPSHQDLDFFVRIAKDFKISWSDQINTKMYWDAANRISDNSNSVIGGAVYMLNKHEQRTKELGVYHHVARKVARKQAHFGNDLKEAYKTLMKSLKFKPFYFYGYIYFFKLLFLSLKKQ